jgi:acyl carrier protein
MRPGFVLGDDDRLLERGIIDSMGVLELIAFLETEFGIVVVDEDVTDENLGTLASIHRYVASRRRNGNSA